MDYKKYINILPYPTRPAKPVVPMGTTSSKAFREHADALDKYNIVLQEYELLRKKYSERNGELYAAFKVDALKEVGLWGHEAGNRAFEYAWEQGHSAGNHEVFIHLERIAYVIFGEK